MDLYYKILQKPAILGLCSALFLFSNLLYFLVPAEESLAYLPLLGLQTLQFILLLLIFVGAFHSWETHSLILPSPIDERGAQKNYKQRWFLFLLLIATGIGSRIFAWGSDPILENDFWRYMWDGHVFSNGVNPYTFAPNSQELDHLQIWFREFVGFPHYRTIYPPIAQYIFAVPAILFPGSVVGLKVVLTLFDLATAFLIGYWLYESKKNLAWSLLYFLNPLVIKEIANSAHLDSIVVFFAVLAIYFIRKQLFAKAWVVLSLAVGTKLFPILLVPFFWKQDPRRWRNLLLFVGLIILFYLPFLDAGMLLFSGTKAFAQHWIWNASLFKVVDWFVQQATPPYLEHAWVRHWLRYDYFTKLILSSLFACVVLQLWRQLPRQTSSAENAQAWEKTALWLFGWLLLISPVANAWYVLWVLPYAVLTGHFGWLSFSYLALASYSWFYSKDAATYFRTVEYVVLYLLLFGPWVKRQTVAKQSP